MRLPPAPIAGEDFLVNARHCLRWVPCLLMIAATMPSPTWEEAGAAYQKGDWKTAAADYGAITKREPESGRAWYRLGVSQAKLGKPKDAIPAYLRADAIGQNPVVRYGLACAYTQLGDTAQAYAWLEKAVASGFRSVEQMNTDEDLIPLRGAAHFNAIVRRVEWNQRPCAHLAENRQLDFWIGDWQVRSPEGTVVGQNSITVENTDCWIHEHWNGGLGGAGESFNYYNATTKQWHQTWVDDQGEIAEFDGTFKDGAMRLEGYRQGPGKSRVPARLTLTPLADGTVRQLGENSMDGGKTWTVLYDFLYSKSKS